MKKDKLNLKEIDRTPNPYWNKKDEEEHAPVEDDYGEDSNANSVSGRQCNEFEEKYLKKYVP